MRPTGRPETSITSQKIEGLNYTAREVWNLASGVGLTIFGNEFFRHLNLIARYPVSKLNIKKYIYVDAGHIREPQNRDKPQRSISSKQALFGHERGRL